MTFFNSPTVCNCESVTWSKGLVFDTSIANVLAINLPCPNHVLAINLPCPNHALHTSISIKFQRAQSRLHQRRRRRRRHRHSSNSIASSSSPRRHLRLVLLQTLSLTLSYPLFHQPPPLPFVRSAVTTIRRTHSGSLPTTPSPRSRTSHFTSEASPLYKNANIFEKQQEETIILRRNHPRPPPPAPPPRGSASASWWERSVAQSRLDLAAAPPQSIQNQQFSRRCGHDSCCQIMSCCIKKVVHWNSWQKANVVVSDGLLKFWPKLHLFGSHSENPSSPTPWPLTLNPQNFTCSEATLRTPHSQLPGPQC
jgi:hypothetical protein